MEMNFESFDCMTKSQLLLVLEKADAEIERLSRIKALVHEWAAKYPLGGSMDVKAAAEIYKLCEE